VLGNTERPWDEVTAEYEGLGPMARNERAIGEAVREATSHPLLWYPRKVLRELVAFWGVNNLIVIHLQKQAYGPLGVATKVAVAALTVAPYLVVLGLAAIGAAAGARGRGRALLLVFLLGYTALHVLAFGFPRFRLPLLPILFVLAAEAWVRLREGPTLSRPQRRLALLVGLAIAVVVVPSVWETARHPVFHSASATGVGATAVGR